MSPRVVSVRKCEASSNWGSGILSAPEFAWSYLPGSDLKSSLAYPNGLTASWTYGNRGELLEVKNASTAGTISKYAYTYDAAGRRIGCAKSGSAFTTPDTNAYLYNTRSELMNATAAVDALYRYGYAFDDIGNRKTSAERGANSVYAANPLNQYTAVVDGPTTNLPTSQLPNLPTFQPVYDADGNQTLVKTATGIWSVTYNGENRPVQWTCLESNNPNNPNNQTISMSYDRMGRRVTKNNQRFVYDGYLQIADNAGNTYVWDPTEKIATRPLAWNSSTSQPSTSQPSTSQHLFYTHDGNKNVSEVIDSDTDVAAHYEYAPFGALTVSRSTSAASNPWRFSSEYAEDDTATVYYNYRHYEPVTGRWLQRDPIGEDGGMSEYAILANQVFSIDRLGFLDTSADSRGTPSATAKLGIPKDYGEFVLEVTPKNIQEGCELNFIQLVREYTFGVHPGWSEWMVDATRLSDQPPPLQPYYYDFSDSVEQSYLLSDGSVRFLDRPDIGTPMEFYLFIVQTGWLIDGPN